MISRNKNLIIAAVFILAVIGGAWLMGGEPDVFVPEFPPPPVLWDDPVICDETFLVSLEIRVDMLRHNMHLLHRDSHELVPEDGVLFPATAVTAREGDSVFDVLQRETRQAGIHMSSRFTPMFGSAYVEAIGNIFEFDGGALSGWMYSVNGWFPNFGASLHLLSPGNVIEWHYTVDLGRDLGVAWDE